MNPEPISQAAEETSTLNLLVEAEARLRAVNLRTLDHEALPEPADVESILGGWDALLFKAPQGLAQLQSALAWHVRTQRLGIDCESEHTPQYVIEDAMVRIDTGADHIEDACTSLRLALVCLRKARSTISHVSVEEDEQDATPADVIDPAQDTTFDDRHPD